MYFTRNKQANFVTFLCSVMAFSVLYDNKRHANRFLSLGRGLLREALKKIRRIFFRNISSTGGPPSPLSVHLGMKMSLLAHKGRVFGAKTKLATLINSTRSQ